MPSQRDEYTRLDCINAVQRLAEQVDGRPSIQDLNDAEDAPSSGVVYRLFDSWSELLEAAGIKDDEKYTEEDCIAALNECAEAMGVSSVSVSLYREFSQEYTGTDFVGVDLPSAGTIIRICGSWNAAKKKADVGEIPGRAKFKD